MLHPEYHSCDKCGKKIKFIRAINFDIFILVLGSVDEPDLEEYLNEWKECAKQEGTNIKIPNMRKKYELCQSCAKGAYTLLEQYIKAKS